MPEPTQAPRTVSLNDIGLKYIGAMQHLSDLMVVIWGGAHSLNKEMYDELSRGIAGLPSTEFHLPFETARVESERWWLKQSVNELLALSMIFMEDIRKMSGLVAFNVAKATATGDLAALAAELNSAPGQMDFPVRFKQLKERHGMQIPLEAEFMTVASLGRCLFQFNGVVPKGATLVLRLQAVQPPAEGETQPRMGTIERTWKEGEQVVLARGEHAAIFTTVSLFFGGMLNSVQEFAKRAGLPEEPIPE